MTDGIRAIQIMRELGMSLGQPMIAIVGCGGAGSNIVNAVFWNCQGVHTVAVNTDSESLAKVNAHVKIDIGGSSAGNSCGLPEVGERCAEESSVHLRQAIEGYDIVFVVAGLGGGTGSGAAPVIARIAKEEGAVVFAIPILPFSIEANRRSIAMITLEQLQETVNFVVPLDNDKLHDLCPDQSLRATFDIVDKSVIRIIERIYEHSSSYVSDLIDDVSSNYIPIEEIVTAEHETILEEIHAVSHTTLEPSLEFPMEYEWNEPPFNFN